MKLLFITHSPNLTYGAAKSLGYILRNIECEFDLICTKYLYENLGEKRIREYTGNKVGKIYPMWLPYEIKTVSSYSMKNLSLKQKIKKFFYGRLIKVRFIVSKPKIYRLIKKNRYNLIHLNSIVLYPIISKKFNFVIHIRELYSRKKLSSFRKKINQAAGVIYIDYAVQESMKNIETKNSLLLNNPIDMRRVKNVSKVHVAQKYKIDFVNFTIFSIIGVISPEKGVDFVINCFKKIKNKKIILLVVGNGNQDYVEECKRIANNFENIVFTQEVQSIEEIYAISDYIIRADEKFCIGRTVYEGLYSGCDVILQGNKEDYRKIFEINRFRDKIHFYTPRESKDFIEKINELADKKVQIKKQYENIKVYIKILNEFYNNILSREG